MVVKKVEQSEFRVGGKLIWHVENTGAGTQATVNFPNTPSQRNSLISEGVRKVVSEYGEVLRKLSDK